MDGSRFDTIARSWAGAVNRRGFVAGLAALAAAALGLRPVVAACPAGQVQGAGGRCLCRTTGRPPVSSPVCAAGKEACRGCCVAACTGGKVRDAATCTCACPACAPGQALNEATCACRCLAPTACCTCANDAFELVGCATDVADFDGCTAACAAAGGHLSSFASPVLGSSFVCAADLTCAVTCRPN
jgi:hypothetical protein